MRSRDGVYVGDDGVTVRRAARRAFTEPLVVVGGSGSVLDPGPAELEAAAVGTRGCRAANVGEAIDGNEDEAGVDMHNVVGAAVAAAAAAGLRLIVPQVPQRNRSQSSQRRQPNGR